MGEAMQSVAYDDAHQQNAFGASMSSGAQDGAQDGAQNGARSSCTSLEDLCNVLEVAIMRGVESGGTECTTTELTLDLDAVLPLLRPRTGPYADGGQNDLPQAFKTNWIPEDKAIPTPQATVRAVISVTDLGARQAVQRAASRGIVGAIEVLDGFKYSFNNVWSSKDDDGQRFSYICQDSMQNKDRNANGSLPPKGQSEPVARKATYDCRGTISVKFSLTRGSLEVHYRHYAIHPSVASRKPQRNEQSRQGRKFKPFEGPAPYRPRAKKQKDGGLAGMLQKESSAYPDPADMLPTGPENSNIGKPLKRKRDSEGASQSQPNGPQWPLSFAEFLRNRQDKVEIGSSPNTNGGSVRPPPVEYDLPTWLKAPSPPPPPPASAPSKSRPSKASKFASAAPSKDPSTPVSTSQPLPGPYPTPYQSFLNRTIPQQSAAPPGPVPMPQTPQVTVPTRPLMSAPPRVTTGALKTPKQILVQRGLSRSTHTWRNTAWKNTGSGVFQTLAPLRGGGIATMEAPRPGENEAGSCTSCKASGFGVCVLPLSGARCRSHTDRYSIVRPNQTNLCPLRANGKTGLSL